jgi:hypothetical protein
VEDGMIEILSGFPSIVLAVRAHGRLTADDYRPPTTTGRCWNQP